MRPLVWQCLLLVCAGFVVAGCSKSAVTEEGRLQASNPSNIYRLTNLYSSFADQHRGVGPKDEKQFREFIEKMGAERLGRIGVDVSALDSLFSSERDGQPFVITYRQKKADVHGPAAGGKDGGVAEIAIVREAVGQDGLRQVGFLGTRAVKSLDESAIAQLK
jgi:hypothetical protein